MKKIDEKKPIPLQNHCIPIEDLGIDLVDLDSIDRIVGVSPCHPQARTGTAILTVLNLRTTA